MAMLPRPTDVTTRTGRHSTDGPAGMKTGTTILTRQTNPEAAQAGPTGPGAACIKESFPGLASVQQNAPPSTHPTPGRIKIDEFSMLQRKPRLSHLAQTKMQLLQANLKRNWKKNLLKLNLSLKRKKLN